MRWRTSHHHEGDDSMLKLARPITLTAASLALIGFGTTGVAVAAAGTSPLGSQTVQASTQKSLRPTSIPLKATKSTVAPNQKVTLTGRLKSGHTPVAAAPVTLETRAAGTKAFTLVSTKTTDSNGKVTLVVAPGKTKGPKVKYRLSFAGDATYRGSHSQIITLNVS